MLGQLTLRGVETVRNDDSDRAQIVERLAWTPKQRLDYLVDMVAFEERAHSQGDRAWRERAAQIGNLIRVSNTLRCGAGDLIGDASDLRGHASNLIGGTNDLRGESGA
jgi:hypothetical protein